jgi:hypothetical protein
MSAERPAAKAFPVRGRGRGSGRRATFHGERETHFKQLACRCLRKLLLRSMRANGLLHPTSPQIAQ